MFGFPPYWVTPQDLNRTRLIIVDMGIVGVYFPIIVVKKFFWVMGTIFINY